MTAPAALPLPLGPAVQLAHALVDDCATQVGAQFVVLKGLGGQRQGLQQQRPPGDVDILLRPADFNLMKASLHSRGWHLRPVDVDDTAFPRHSETYFHPSWPCDIDMHYRFPGLDGSPEDVFDTLWNGAERIEIAGRSIAIPCAEAQLIIVALHCLRSPGVEKLRHEYRWAVREGAARFNRRRVLELADDLGAAAAVHPFLVEAFGHASEQSLLPSDDWRFRTRYPSPNARRLASFAAGSARQRLHLMRIAAFPDRQTLLKSSLSNHASGVVLVRAYLRRWLRGAAALPSALREYLVARRR